MTSHRAVLTTLCVAALLCFAAGCNKEEPPAAEGQAAGRQDLEAPSWRSRYETLVEQSKGTYKELDELRASNEALSGQVEALQQKLQERDKNEEARAEMDRELTGLNKQLEEKDLAIARLLEEMKRADSERGGAAANETQGRKVCSELQSLATEAIQERRWELARRLLTSAVELGADEPEVFFTVAYCCGNLGDHNAAAGWYEKAIGHPDVIRASGGGASGAAVSATQGTTPTESPQPVPPRDFLAKLYNNYAATLVKLHREDEALEWYQKAVQADEEYPAVYYNLGRLYEEHLKQPEDAVQAYRRHVALGGSRSAQAAERIQKLESRE